MKKRILLIAGTFVVLLLAFVVYNVASREGLPGIWRFNPRVNPAPGQPETVPPVGDIWDTPNPEILVRDKNHRLQARYKASLERKVGDRFYLDDPLMEWYLKDGEVVTVTAKRGVLKASEAAGHWKMLEGELIENVWVVLDRNRDPQRTPLEERPGDAVRIHLDRAHFDNELLTIQSDSPLTLFSKEADVLGKGLRLDWNEGRRRFQLQQLRIEHGEYMCIREGQERFLTDLPLPGGGGRAPAAPPGVGVAPPEGGGSEVGLRSPQARRLMPPPRPLAPVWMALGVPGLVLPAAPVLAAAADLPAVDLPGTPMPPPTASQQATVKDTYVAVFTGDVKVTSGERYLRGAEELRLTFEYRTVREGGQAATAPATASAKPLRPETPGPSRSAASKPASQPSDAIYITWTGPLVITPLPGDEPLVARRFDVFAQGAKLELSNLQGQATCKTLEFRTPSQQGELTGTTQTPVQMWMATGEKIVVPRIRFDRTAGVINLDGPGSMALSEQGAATGMPSRTGRSGERQELSITWTGDVVAQTAQRTIRSPEGERFGDYLRQARFAGEVNVQQGKSQTLRADDLVVAFAVPKAPGDPANRVSELHAAGGVHLADADTGDFVKSKTLDVEMGTVAETGRLYPRVATAKGDVTARQEKAEIAGDQVIVTMSPQRDEKTGQIQPKPQRLQAAGKVHVVDRGEPEPLTVEAETIDADVLAKTATLTGAPAKVAQKEGAITGEKIFMDQPRELANVAGAGTLRFYTGSDLSGNKTDKAQPVDVAWTKAMDYRGKERSAVVNGDVQLDTAEDHLRCQVMRVLFAPGKPSQTTQPAGSGRLAGARAFRPQAISMVMADKAVKLVSDRTDAEGCLERQLYLQTEQLVYAFAQAEARPESKETSPSQKLNCYGPGIMYLGDYRPPQTTAGGRGGAEVAPIGKVSTPNQTALEWSKSMEMDQKDLSIRAVGNVRMVLRDGGQVVLKEKLKVRSWGTLPVGRISDLTCEKMLAQFDPPQEGSASPRSKGDITGPRVGPLNLFDAFGDAARPDDLVKLLDGGREVHCRRLIYQRDKDVARIYGSMPGEPPRNAEMFYTDPQKKTFQSWREPVLTWYRATNRVEAKDVEAHGGR